MNGQSQADLKSFRDLAERFAKRELEAKAIDHDDYPFCEFNRAALEAAREAGLLSATLPESAGGAGQGISALCEILIELAKADASFAASVFFDALARSALVEWGKKEVVEQFLGSSLIGSPAYDLPTDLGGELAAAAQGENFALSGKFEYVALAPVADAIILPARIQGRDRLSMFILKARSEGVKVSEPVLSLGLRGCPVADVSLEGALVPAANLLCADAEAEYPKLAARFRPAAAALCVGVAEGSYQAAKAYAKERYQGGRMIIDYDMVRMLLVNLAVIAESGRALVRSMAAAADQGRSWPVSEAGLILLGEQAARAATDGVQVLGGYGYMQDYGQEKRMRDAKQIQGVFGAAPQKRLELMAEILRQEE